MPNIAKNCGVQKGKLLRYGGEENKMPVKERTSLQ
jgi:hypothetical protein